MTESGPEQKVGNNPETWSVVNRVDLTQVQRGDQLIVSTDLSKFFITIIGIRKAGIWTEVTEVEKSGQEEKFLAKEFEGWVASTQPGSKYHPTEDNSLGVSSKEQVFALHFNHLKYPDMYGLGQHGYGGSMRTSYVQEIQIKRSPKSMIK